MLSTIDSRVEGLLPAGERGGGGGLFWFFLNLRISWKEFNETKIVIVDEVPPNCSINN